MSAGNAVGTREGRAVREADEKIPTDESAVSQEIFGGVAVERISVTRGIRRQGRGDRHSCADDRRRILGGAVQMLRRDEPN